METRVFAVFCGTSIVEALERDCRFEQMVGAWLPPHCRDDELTAKWETKGNSVNGTWNYWADNDRTQKLTADELAMFGGTRKKFYVDWEWHVGHCLYYWEKTMRQRLKNTGVVMESWYDKVGHVSHCTEIVFSNRSLTAYAEVIMSSKDVNRQQKKMGKHE